MPSPPQLDIFPAYDKRRAESTGLRKWIYKLSPIPLHTLTPLVFELRLSALRLLNRGVSKRFEGARDLMVNIGPGPYGKPGWVNVDIFKGEGIDCVYDCRKHLPFPDGSVHALFCEHVFEHIDYTEEAPHFLAECYRVLQPGGVVRIIVPDAERYLRAYCAEGWDQLADVRQLGEDRFDPHHGGHYRTKMELINVLFRQGFEHKFLYDYETLALLLTEAGFNRVERQECGASVLDELAIDKPERASESLYVEAIK